MPKESKSQRREARPIRRRDFLISSAGLAAASALLATPSDNPHPDRKDVKMNITRSGSKEASAGPADYFTGTVQVQMLAQAKDPSRVSIGEVMFQPGARTAWHTHPAGQHLVITSGTGWVQQENGPRQEVRPGDVVWFPPDVRHWHGATDTAAMTHLAIQESVNGSPVTWMEKVSDTQYLSDTKEGAVQ